MKFTNKQYNVIKYLITIFLPALGAFYFALATLWNLPQPTGVNGTINATIAFLGLLIGYSTRQYNKTENSPDGELIVGEVDGEKYLGLGVTASDMETMTHKDTVTLRVVDKSALPPVPGVPTVNPGGSISGPTDVVSE